MDEAAFAQWLAGVLSLIRPQRGEAFEAWASAEAADAPGRPGSEAPDLHTNNVNACHGRLKQWLRLFHGAATKNLLTCLSGQRTIDAPPTASNSDAWSWPLQA